MSRSRQVALVTGANRGIGLQIASELAAKGILVALGSRDLERGKAAAAQIGAGIYPLQLDVTDPKSISDAARRMRSDFGRLDILIQNAAISLMNRSSDQSIVNFYRSNRPSVVDLNNVRVAWETNVFGVIAVYQAFLPLLRETKGARIINISSAVASLTVCSQPGSANRALFDPVYAASKAALNAITIAMAIELEQEGIAVCAVSPGFTCTNLNNYSGTQTLQEGAREAVRVALGEAHSTAVTFTRWEGEIVPW